MDGKSNRVIITVLGRDQVGIIARLAAELAQCRINIVDISQTILADFFTMLMIVDMEQAVVDLDQLQLRLHEAGESLGVQVTAQHEDVFRYMHRI